MQKQLYLSAQADPCHFILRLSWDTFARGSISMYLPYDNIVQFDDFFLVYPYSSETMIS